jgi:hypothetical protein
VNAFAGTWECTGSHFAGGQQDCQRRHGSSGHGPIDHRVVVGDADLNNAGATYYYESYYVVRGDENLPNNWGSRICTMNWNGSSWSFTTPGTNNDLVENPALLRWGPDLATYVNTAVSDGRVLLAVKTTDLGGGNYHYEYAMLNMESDRQVRSFSIPVEGVGNITNIGFHDSDLNPANDWQVSLDGNNLTWETETFAQNPNANALEFGLMFNFRFDAAAPPDEVFSSLGVFKPGVGTEVKGATHGPVSATTAVHELISPVARARLVDIRPNPLNRSTTIHFELGNPSGVELNVYDASGRLVRSLLTGSRGSGAHAVVWDGKAAGGDQVRSGVYYARLRAGSATAVKSMVVVN